ncbi:hypothetical protein FMEAI12_4190037 [Parafrankia sp. Ea1.12]|nr:hypothetical protein FMEAI12_4190037 [Parafrankia sp. Ea1.12]
MGTRFGNDVFGDVYPSGCSTEVLVENKPPRGRAFLIHDWRRMIQSAHLALYVTSLARDSDSEATLPLRYYRAQVVRSAARSRHPRRDRCGAAES